ncbi:helix-turn-helix domain-containing protein [Patulibacter minatonensis]|uniref:helix-turn-helix domain-containing protein n=1 Tax=Patulibacter minatonensis TaxID=298163 RepID=UPI00047CA7E1|nr:helix-turn-helix transcriptional regulator [Patulibacter minatonensis]
MSEMTALEVERKKQGMSRDQLAARSGITTRTIQNHERYGMTPHWAVKRALAEGLGCDVGRAFPSPTAGQEQGRCAGCGAAGEPLEQVTTTTAPIETFRMCVDNFACRDRRRAGQMQEPGA